MSWAYWWAVSWAVPWAVSPAVSPAIRWALRVGVWLIGHVWRGVCPLPPVQVISLSGEGLTTVPRVDFEHREHVLQWRVEVGLAQRGVVA